MIKKEEFYNWLFHYNSYADKWSAFHRDDTTAYWNGTDSIHPIYSHPDLFELVKILENCELCL